MNEQELQSIIDLINASALDQTIKDILIRDLQAEGLTDFLREQIIAYCDDALKKLDAKAEAAKKVLEAHGVDYQAALTPGQ